MDLKARQEIEKEIAQRKADPCVCGHARSQHPDPYLCAVPGCRCGEYQQQRRYFVQATNAPAEWVEQNRNRGITWITVYATHDETDAMIEAERTLLTGQWECVRVQPEEVSG